MSNIFTYIGRGTGSLPLHIGVGTLGSIVRSQHLNLDDAGSVYAVLDGTITHYGAGLPFDINGRLVVSEDAVTRIDQSIPFTASGMVSVGIGAAGSRISQSLAYSSTGQLSAVNIQAMILTVRTTVATETFTLPFQPSLPVNPWNAVIDWGDGSSDTITTFNDAALAHEYAVADDYDITISGSANCVFFNATGDKDKLIDVKQWGRTGWTSCQDSFHGCNLCVFTAGPIADTSNVTSIEKMFRICSVGDPDVTGFDTSLVTRMASMFQLAIVANPDVSGFDTSSVTDMIGMFNTATLADPDISGFDIGLVTNMTNMMLSSAFSDANYDLALVAFNNQSHQNTVTAHFGTAQFSVGAPAAAKAALEADGWVISDNGPI